jgi:hypothetical protein
MLARRLFYCLRHSARPFCVVIFETGSLFMPGAGLTIILLVLLRVAGVPGMCHNVESLVEMGVS